MSVWESINQFLSRVASETVFALAETVRTLFEGDPQTRRQVGFSVAIIALSAKMAKADGIVTEDEVEAFRSIFEIPEREADNVSRLYNLARQDVAGFDAYAQQVKRLFPEEQDILTDVLDALFFIAKADGVVHELEMEFITHVAGVFGITGKAFERLRMRHVSSAGIDAYVRLEADPAWDAETLRRHYRKMVQENHPDRMISRGVPEEFLKLANERLAEINLAWDEIRAERGI